SCRSELSFEIDRLIGSKYEDHARGPTRFDCMGICLYITKRFKGIELVDPVGIDYSPAAVLRFRNQFKRVELDEIEPLDWLHVLGSRRQHLAIVEDATTVVEATREAGVIRTPLAEILSQRA